MGNILAHKEFTTFLTCTYILDYGDNHWIWWHSSSNVDRQNCGFVFLRICYFIFRTSGGNLLYIWRKHITTSYIRMIGDPGFWFCPQSTTKTTTKAFQSTNTGGCQPDSKLMEVLRGWQELQLQSDMENTFERASLQHHQHLERGDDTTHKDFTLAWSWSTTLPSSLDS